MSLIVCLSLLTGYQYISAQWTPASGTPPANNSSQPLNVGPTTQFKSGNLSANILAATTEVRSNRYCDALGNNCFTAASVAGGSNNGTVTIGGICFEPTWAVACNWNWSGSGNDNSIYFGPLSVNPVTICSSVGRTYQYHYMVLEQCGG